MFKLPVVGSWSHDLCHSRVPLLGLLGFWVTVGLEPLSVAAQVQPMTQQGGPPNLPIPAFAETGLPDFTMPVGSPSVLPPGFGGGGTGAGSGSGTTGGTPADEVLSSRSWGALAASNSAQIGVNPTALAATCVMESGCQNIGGPGSVSGAFQMTNATYTQDIKRALAQNPSLSGTIDTSLAGKMDPANQAIASAQDLKSAALSLQSSGLANPTFLDTRAIYQWGSGAGPDVAKASDSYSMTTLLSPYYTSAQLAANGVTSSTTVGQWRQTIINKVGSAASQKILI